MNNSNSPSPMSFYFLVLVEVIFQTTAGIAVLKRQIFEKSDIDVFPAERIHRLNNVAALQVRQSLDPELQGSFQALDAFILGIVPLGRMTQEAFWQGIEQPSADAGQEAPVAAGETAVTDTASTEAAPSNVTPIRPELPHEAVLSALEAEAEGSSETPFPEAFHNEPIAPSEVGPGEDFPVDSDGLEPEQTGQYGEDDIPGSEDGPFN